MASTAMRHAVQHLTGGPSEMGIGFLVRHAQASFLEPNYDKLSKLGEAQACLLGEYWARHKILFDRACWDPCVRQKALSRS